LTTLVVLPALLAFIYYAGPAPFTGFVAFATYVALREFFAMSLPKERILERGVASLLGVFLLFAFLPGRFVVFQAALVFSVLFFGIWFLFRFRELSSVVTHLSLVGFAFLYLPLMMGHLVLLRALPFGREWIFLVLLIVMSGDTAAYLTGVSIGKHKLYPAISPNTSVEGSMGGLLGSLCGAFVARIWFFPSLEWADCIVLALFLGILGQLGDLFESMLKRGFGVKDSGTIIPGHGGMLDRLDSLLFAFPPAYYYALLRFGG